MNVVPFQKEQQIDPISQATRSVKWTLSYNLAPRLVTPFSTIILAAILTPSDFGLVAISTFIIALARILVDMGLSKAVIQRRSKVDEAASVSLWISLFISTGFYLLLWLAAPWISTAYGNEYVVNVIRVSSLSLPLFAAASIPKALLVREMAFRKLFWVNSSFLILQAIASVILALAGMGYWSLILGQLFGLFVHTGLAWKMVKWRPTMVMNPSTLVSLLTFSVWVMLSSLQNWMFLYADNAIAGLFLGVQGLGIYSLGFTIATLIPGFLMASVSDVAYPVFCRIQEDPPKVGENLVKLQRLIGTLLFPIALGFSAIAAPAVDLLYGQKWQGLGMVLAILTIMPGLSYIWSINENAYQAIGRPDIWTKLAGASLIGLIPLLWFAAPYGLLVFTIFRFAGAWFLPLGNILFGANNLGISIKEQLQTLVPPLIFSLIMFFLVFFIINQMAPLHGVLGWIKLLTTIAAGAAVYLLLIWRIKRELWNELILYLRQMIS
jgi:O-antigen/teichoic acid export membrane protein